MTQVTKKNIKIESHFNYKNDITLYLGSCLDLLKEIPDESIQLIVTSPPYNIGKEYEKRSKLDNYLNLQKEVIKESYRVLKKDGSICWQTGNYVDNWSIIPLDILLYPIFDTLGMKMRNRIIWHFGHWLHASRRFSGRYETIVWFTKSDNYYFNLDPIRVPQKYPNKKHFKGDKKWQISSNPLGKNPSDIWNIPNVKSNHVEKTEHPCQFPVALVERLVLALTQEWDIVFDPFMGSWTTAIASLLHSRKSVWADLEKKYINIAKQRINLFTSWELKTRPIDQPIYEPKDQKWTDLYVNFCGNEVLLV